MDKLELKDTIIQLTVDTQEEILREIEIWSGRLTEITKLHKGKYVLTSLKNNETVEINLSTKNEMLEVIEMLKFLIKQLN